jgi:hypothetical protein
MEPAQEERLRRGIALACFVGVLCGLAIVKTLRQAQVNDIAGITYWLVFVIASGLLIQRSDLPETMRRKDWLLLLQPTFCVILVIVVPHLLV